MFRLALGPTQTSVQRILGFFPEAKHSGLEVHHCLLVVRLKMKGSVLPFLLHAFTHEQGNFHFICCCCCCCSCCFVCVRVCVCVCVCMYVCMYYVCMYVCMCVCVFLLLIKHAPLPWGNTTCCLHTN